MSRVADLARFEKHVAELQCVYERTVAELGPNGGAANAVAAELAAAQRCLAQARVAAATPPPSPPLAAPPARSYNDEVHERLPWVTYGPIWEAKMARTAAELADLARQRRQDRGAPYRDRLSDDEKDALSYCLDERGHAVVSDIELTHLTGICLDQMREIAGGPQVRPATVGYVEIDGWVLGKIAEKLHRAMRIAMAVRGRPFDAALYRARRLGRPVRPDPSRNDSTSPNLDRGTP